MLNAPYYEITLIDYTVNIKFYTQENYNISSGLFEGYTYSIYFDVIFRFGIFNKSN
jgi:hypothetical protein